jgi:hypothetical protein
VIRAHEVAALDVADRQLELAVRAAVLDRAHLAVLAAEHAPAAPPEHDLLDLPDPTALLYSTGYQ